MIKIFISALAFMFTIHIFAQTSDNKTEIGVNLSQYQKDFGVGLHVITPYIAKTNFAIKIGANIQWFENATVNETSWDAYQNIQLGVRVRNTILENKMFCYAEGGAVALLTNSRFSSTEKVFGGYGLFGFEFRPANRITYFVELGGIGTGAVADKIASNPIYSNGFLTNAGFRVRL